MKMKNKMIDKKVKKIFAGVSAPVFILLVATYYLLPTIPAYAFTGPGSQSAGSGSGALGSDSANNVSVGTSTTQASTKLLVVASSTDSTNYVIKVINSASSPILYLRNDASVGIATTTLGAGTLTVNGTIFSTGNLTGNLAANYVTSQIFPSGNFAFQSSLGVATTSNVGLPSELSVYGSGLFTVAVSSTGITFTNATSSNNLLVGTFVSTGAINGSTTATFQTGLTVNVGGVTISAGGITQAGGINSFKTSTFTGNVTTTALSITNLGGASGCLSVTASGQVNTSTCSGGAGITSLNSLSGATQTFSTSTALASGFDIRSSGTVHTWYLANSLSQISSVATTTGNILVASTTNGWVGLAVGSNGKVLTASSTAVSGVSWETASGGGVSGGTANWIPMWTGATTLGTSTLLQSGTTTYTLNGFAIGTTTLQSAGALYATGAINAAGGFAGNLAASYVTSAIFPSGNFTFQSSLGVNTSSNVGLPQPFSAYGNGYFSNGLLIGTSTTSNALVVANASGTSVFDVSTSTSPDNVFEVYDSSGNLRFSIATSSGAISASGTITFSVLGSPSNPCITVGSGGLLATSTCGGLSGGSAGQFAYWTSASALSATSSFVSSFNGATGTISYAPSTTIATKESQLTQDIGNPSTSTANTWTGSNTWSATTTFQQHIITSGGTAPTVSACGTGSPTISGADNAGVVTTGSGTNTSCLVTFGKVFAATPICIAENVANTATTTISASTSVRGFQPSFTPGLAAGKLFNYICIGN